MRSAWGLSASAAVIVATGLPLATGLVMLSDQSPAWPLALAIALAGAAAMLLSRNLTQAMFLGFMFALPFDIAKSILPPNVIYYYPGLWIGFSDLFLTGFLTLWFFGRKLVQREAFASNPLVRFGLWYTAYLWFSALVAIDPIQGLVMALTHTKYLVAFLAVSDYIRKPADLRGPAMALAAGLAFQLAMVAAQLVTRSYLQFRGTNLADTGNLTFSGGMQAFRPTGFLKHPIALADYLVFLLLPATGILLAGRRAVPRWGFLLLLALGGGFALVATLSRGGWIAFGVSALFVFLIAISRGLIRRQWLGGGAVVVVVALAVTAVAYPAAYLRLVESDQRSSEGRVLMMDQAMLIGRNHPVLGVGMGGYHRAAKTFRPASFGSANEILREALISNLGVVHNKYLLVFAEHGGVGVALLVALLWKSVRLFFRVPRWNTRVQELAALGLAGALVGQAVMYLFDHFYQEVGLLMFWVFAGLLAALARAQGSPATPSETRP